MSSEERPSKSRERARHAVESIDAIRDYLAEHSRDSYSGDRKTQSATERELLIVSEAVARLLDLDPELQVDFPSVPWPQIRGLGNRLRHEYEKVDVAIVWETVSASGDLDLLRDALAKRYLS